MFSQVVLDASKLGLSVKGNNTRDGFWKFTSSSVFAATVITTIGAIFRQIAPIPISFAGNVQLRCFSVDVGSNVFVVHQRARNKP